MLIFFGSLTTIYISLSMASLVVQGVTSSLTGRTLKPLYSTEQAVSMEAEGLITRIRTAMSRYHTNRDAVENAETLNEIENILGGPRMPSLDLSEDGTTAVIVPETKPVNAAEEARWQLQTRLPISVRTHPTNFEPYEHHIEELQTFKDDLLLAKECSERKEANYSKVEVLLITWEKPYPKPKRRDIHDDVEKEVAVFTKLLKEVNYNITPFEIPADDSHNELQGKVLDFLRGHKKDVPGDTLFIIYYNGHGSIKDEKCYWHQTAKTSSPTVEWAQIQQNFERASQDVLFILDCCYAGSAALNKGSTYTKELLAACGSAEQTLAGPQSFTVRIVKCFRALLKEEPIFPVSWLYDAMIKVSQDPVPIYTNLNRSYRTICLKSMADIPGKTLSTPHLVPPPNPGIDNLSSVASSHTSSIFSGDQDMSDDATQLSIPEPDPVVPQRWQYKVLLSVKLRENIIPQAKDWCLSFPPGQVEGLDGVTIQSIYPTKSTLMLLTMPVRQWALLRDNPAYTFIDFVESNDVLHSHPGDEDAIEIHNQVLRRNTDKTSSSKDSEQKDLVGYMLAAMHDFFQKVQSVEDNKQRKPGPIARTCQHIATKVGIPSRFESDPRFGLAKYIVQHLNIDRNDEGDFTSVSYDLHFNVLIEKLFESTRKNLKDTLYRNGKDGALEIAITTEFDDLKNEVVKMTKLETEKLTVKGFEKPKSSLKSQARTTSITKHAKFDGIVLGNEEVACTPANTSDTMVRKESRTNSAKSKGPLGKTNSAGRPLMSLFERRFSKGSLRTDSPLSSPRASTNFAFPPTTT